jgi:hypothetical protein
MAMALLALSIRPLPIGSHLLPALNLVALILGIFGSLFTSYNIYRRDLRNKGRPNPILGLLRIVSPSLISGTAMFLVAVALELILTSGALTPSNERGILYLTVLGLILGTFNGLFVQPFNAKEPRSAFFSWKHACIGAVISVGYILLYYFVRLVLLQDAQLFQVAFVDYLTIALISGFLMGGVWTWLNWYPLRSEIIPFFSLRGSVIGTIVGFLLAFSSSIVLYYSGVLQVHDAPNLNAPLLAVLTAGTLGAIGLIGGGLSGGISQFNFWWVESQTEDAGQAIGILMIFLAFVFQLVTPLLQLFNIIP